MSADDPLDPGWATSFRTRRGDLVRVRHLVPADAPLLVDLFYHLSERTRYLRFFAPLTNLTPAQVVQHATRLACLDPGCDALVGLVDDAQAHEHAVAVARLAQRPDTPQIAEVAIVVRDDYQRSLIGRTMMGLLIDVARARGVTMLTAITIAENYPVLSALRRSGLSFHVETHQGEAQIEIYI